MCVFYNIPKFIQFIEITVHGLLLQQPFHPLTKLVLKKNGIDNRRVPAHQTVD